MSDSTSRGQFVWYDLMTSDTDAALNFYKNLIGWGTMAWEGGTSRIPCGPTTMCRWVVS
jgi:predicted enzyme related to lactoylglutathione lyase